jgi:Rrf2 family nitric oxide-sensitive transcriptional repressor
MRLTLHTDYALRVLIHVAIADGKLVTISDIAETFGISKQHLMKVANNLSRKGYLHTLRGRGGGSRITSPQGDNIQRRIDPFDLALAPKEPLHGGGRDKQATATFSQTRGGPRRSNDPRLTQS